MTGETKIMPEEMVFGRFYVADISFRPSNPVSRYVVCGRGLITRAQGRPKERRVAMFEPFVWEGNESYAVDEVHSFVIVEEILSMRRS